MSRSTLVKACLLLALMPVMAMAQSADRSRGRTEKSRSAQVERDAKQSDRPSLREDKVTPSKQAKKAKNTQTSDRVTQRTRQAKESKNRGSDSKSKARQESRSDSKSKARQEKGRDRSKIVKREREKRKVVEHKSKKRVAPKRKPHRAFEKRHQHRRPARRYAHRVNRYHRRHATGLSLGFFIRIPSVRWHVGHTRRFVFRQVVRGHAFGDVEIQSTFKRKIRNVNRDYVEVEFELDRVSVVSGARFLGEVDKIPGNLRRVRAKVYRDGFVEFDRMLYVIGNDFRGFELLSTRYCGGDLAAASYECLDTRSGELDFYRERVSSTRYSQFLYDAQLGRAVPVALVPDEEYLGFQYVMGYGRSDDGYYSGSFDYSSLSRTEKDGGLYRLSDDQVDAFEPADGNWMSGSMPIDDSGFEHESVVTYAGKDGATVELQHEAEVRFLDD